MIPGAACTDSFASLGSPLYINSRAGSMDESVPLSESGPLKAVHSHRSNVAATSHPSSRHLPSKSENTGYEPFTAAFERETSGYEPFDRRPAPSTCPHRERVLY